MQDNRYQEIINERERGSTIVAQKALDLLTTNPEYAPRLAHAFSDMASVVHICQAIENKTHTIDHLQNELTKGLEQAANGAARLAQKEDIVLTISYSGTVIRAVQIAGCRAGVLESLPGGEGRLTAEALGGTLYPDSQCLSAVEASTQVWVGADAVYDDAFYNKVGTRHLLETARRVGRPTVVVTDPTKKLAGHAPQPRNPLFEVVPLTLIDEQVSS